MKNKIYKIYTYILGIVNLNYLKKVSEKQPIIIGGCGRSGTTLLLSILSAHSKIHGVEIESGLFSKKKLNVYSKAKTKLFLSKLLFNNRKKSAHRWAEKTPKNVRNIPEIINFFKGKVKIIIIIRDGRDVITSMHPSKKNEYWVSVQRWIEDVELGLKYSNYKQVYTIRYEDIIYNFDTCLENVLAFLEEKPEKEIKEYVKYTNIKRNNAWENNVQKIHSESIEKWRKPEHKERLSEFLNNNRAVRLLNKLGYTK